MSLAGAIKAGKAFVEIGTDNNPLYRGLKSAARAINTYSANIASMGAKFIGAGAALLTPVYLAISAGSDLEETMNKFNVVFGENAAAVKAWGDEYGDQVGRSKRQIADFLGSNQDLLVPMGFEEGAATQMSKDITGLAVDLASFNNKADADVLNDLQAALTGSGEVMKKYGVIVSQSAVNQELLNMQLSPKAATEAQKAQARWNIIMRGTTAAQGDAIRSSGSWANQMKALKATIEDQTGAIGSKLLPVVAPLLMQFKNGVKIIGEFIANNAGMVFGVASLGAVLLAAGGGAIGLAIALKVVALSVGVLASVVGLVMSPLGLIVGGLAALIYYSGAGGEALSWLSDQFGGLGEFAQETFGLIKRAMDAGEYKLAAELLWAGIKVAFYSGTQGLSVAVTDWKEFFLATWEGGINQAAGFFINKWATLQMAWAKITQFFGDAWDIVVGRIVGTWKDAQNTIADYALDVIAAVDPTIDKEAARAELYSMQDQEAKDRTNERNQSIQKREQETKAELAAITANKEGATAELGEEAKRNDDAREARLKAARKAAADAVTDAKNELKALTAQTNALPAAEKTALVKNAKANAGFGSSPQAQRALGGSSVDLRTEAGAKLIADLFNQSSEDKTLKEIQTGNGLMSAMVSILEDRLLKTAEV